MANNSRKREVAWRVFAREFNSASVELPGEDQYTPTYVLSPLGALINRVYFAGVLTECENAGSDLEPLWRGRVSDPTDVFYISAGQFQPKAARILAELEVPALVGIVGKARTYSPDDTTIYVSVRVEQVKTITQEIRDYWVVEACQSLTYRLGCLAEALQMQPPNLQKLMSLGYSKHLSMGIVEAINQYSSINIQEYGELLVNTLKDLAIDSGIDSTLISPHKQVIGDLDTDVSPAEETEMEISKNNFKLAIDETLKPEEEFESSENNKPTTEEEDKEETEDKSEVLEKLVFDIITDLVEDNPEGVIYEAVQAAAAEHGLERARVEEFISSLIDKGIIYEPSIGLFKTV